MAQKKKPQQHHKQVKQGSKPFRIEYLLLGVLIVLTIITYASSLKNPFMYSWDDSMHVVDNMSIKEINGENIKALFTPNTKHLYHPLTMLSFAIEYKLFELKASAYHFTNLLLHLINILLVYFFVNILTKRKEIGLFVAAIFALHPMQVEAVAWVSERKDVLYTAFFMGALIYYVKYSSEHVQKYLYIALGLFVGSLLSKPAAVTLPVVLILLDYYLKGRITKKDILTKIPFFLLSILFGIIPFFFQKSTGDIKELATTYTLVERMFLASYALCFYIIKYILPVNLSALYYLPEKTNGLFPYLYYVAPAGIAGIGFLLYKAYIKNKKEMITGFLFFVVTVSLVLQIIPIGRVITADRYSYVPFIGLSLMAGFMLVELTDKNRKIKNYVYVGFMIVILVFSYQSVQRIKIWQSGIALFTDVIEKNPEKPHAWAARAYDKLNSNDNEGAILDYDKAISLQINDAEAFNNRGNAKYNLKRYEEAMADYELSIKTKKSYPLPYYNRAQIKELLYKDYRGVIQDYTIAIHYDSTYMLAYNARGMAWYRLNELDKAMQDIDKTIALEKLYPNGWHNKGLLLFTLKKYEESLPYYDKAIQLNPNFGLAYANRAVSKFYLNKKNEACLDWNLAVQQGYTEAEAMIKIYCATL